MTLDKNKEVVDKVDKELHSDFLVPGYLAKLVGWLFWTYRPFETVFQSISGRLPERGRNKREMIDERKKNVQTTPPAPTASAVGPCPPTIQITGRLPSTIASPDHPNLGECAGQSEHIQKLVHFVHSFVCKHNLFQLYTK